MSPQRPAQGVKRNLTDDLADLIDVLNESTMAMMVPPLSELSEHDRLMYQTAAHYGVLKGLVAVLHAHAVDGDIDMKLWDGDGCAEIQ